MPGNVLAGRMAALLDVTSLLPRKIWYEEDSKAHDQTFWKGALEQVQPGMLLLFDLGFVDYEQFDQMSQAGIFFVTRLREQRSRPREKSPGSRREPARFGHLGDRREGVPGDISDGGDQVSGQMVSNRVRK